MTFFNISFPALLLNGNVVANDDLTTESDLTSVATILQYTPNGLDELQYGKKSQSFLLNDVVWYVYLYSSNSGISLGLQSSALSGSSWSSDAELTFKLFPKVETANVIEKKLTKRTYSDRNPSHEIVEFIEYRDFLNDYTIDYEADFEIEITTSKSKRSSELGFQQIYSKFHIPLDDVSNLLTKTSPEVIVRDIKWKVVIERKGEKFGVFLEADKNDMDKTTSYVVVVIIKILTHDGSKSPYFQTFAGNVRWGSNFLGNSTILTWEEFTKPDNKYVLYNEAHLLVEIKVEEPKSLWDI